MKCRFPFSLACSCSFLLLLIGQAFLWGCGPRHRPTTDSPRRPDNPEYAFVADSTVVGVSTVAAGLEVPWELLWGPDDWIWFSEQKGTISKVNPKTGEIKLLLRIAEVHHQKSYGLLGMALHPDPKQPYLFVDYTYLQDSVIYSRLVRYTHRPDTLTDPVVLLDRIPGATYHNGARVAVAPDGTVILSTGDAGAMPKAQDPLSLSGKILRLNPDGTIPADNPLPGSPVWSRGHRNAQGLAYAPDGTLYSSEHGHASDDELNLIRRGGNYGWPRVEGACDRPEEKAFCLEAGVVEPLLAWTPTIAPAALGYYAHSAIPEWRHALLLNTLKDCSFRVLRLTANGQSVAAESVYLRQAFGRLRGLCISPSGDIYLSTSNRDWNPTCEGFPVPTDDRILRLYPIRDPSVAHRALAETKERSAAQAALAAREAGPLQAGKALYAQYCAACHRSDGNGLSGTFPPLQGTPWVMGEKPDLIRVVLRGLSGPMEVKGERYEGVMPAFAFLSDQEVAEVLTFVRARFGEGASAVTPGEVAAQREGK